MTSKTARSITLAAAATAVGALLGGCSSTTETQHAGDIAAIRKDPSPAMETLYLRKSDKRNQRTVAWDTTMRQMHEDGARLFHSDKPSRLTPVTKPY
jgi:uncharacterized lipoprotein YajG